MWKILREILRNVRDKSDENKKSCDHYNKGLRRCWTFHKGYEVFWFSWVIVKRDKGRIDEHVGNG